MRSVYIKYKTPSSLSMEVKDNKFKTYSIYRYSYKKIIETQLSTTKGTNTNILILLSEFYRVKIVEL